MNWHAPALTKELGAYALIAIAVIGGIAWLFDRARSYREPSKDEDPIERQFKEMK